MFLCYHHGTAITIVVVNKQSLQTKLVPWLHTTKNVLKTHLAESRPNSKGVGKVGDSSRTTYVDGDPGAPVSVASVSSSIGSGTISMYWCEVAVLVTTKGRSNLAVNWGFRPQNLPFPWGDRGPSLTLWSCTSPVTTVHSLLRRALYQLRSSCFRCDRRRSSSSSKSYFIYQYIVT